MAFATTIEEHPLLIYTAALHFAPTNTTLYETFHDTHLYSPITRTFGRPWSMLLLALVRGSWTGSTVLSAAFSNDGTRVITGSFDHTIQIWDTSTNTVIFPELRGHSGWVHSVDISADGTRIVSGSRDMTVRIWNMTSGLEASSALCGHTSGVRSVVFSPNGARVYSGSDDMTVRVWDVASAAEALEAFKGHQGEVWSVAVSPDGTYVVSASLDKTIRVWNATSGDAISTLQGGHKRLVNISISSDGTHIISSSYNSNQIWNIESSSRLSSNDQSVLCLSNDINNGWIVDTGRCEKFKRLPSIIRTKSWLLEQLTVKYWFSDFCSLFSTVQGHEE